MKIIESILLFLAATSLVVLACVLALVIKTLHFLYTLI